jgi:flagellar protein FlgJ
MSDMALPSSYLDFNGLAKLKGEAAHDPTQAAKKTAEQFESYFLQQMMKEMRATVEKSDMVDNKAMDTYQDMMDKEVAQQMVRRGGIGLASMLEKQMLQQQAASTQDALRLHPAAATALPLQAPKTALPLEKSGAIKAYELPKQGGRP